LWAITIDEPICACAAGYSGYNCTTIVDNCVNQPCQNAGTCINQIGDYDCKCTSEWSGKNCTVLETICVNPCSSTNSCGAAFTCFDTDSNATCISSSSSITTITSSNGGTKLLFYRLNDLPQTRYSFSATVLNQQLYFIAGASTGTNNFNNLLVTNDGVTYVTKTTNTDALQVRQFAATAIDDTSVIISGNNTYII
jgi:hypothetical protein